MRPYPGTSVTTSATYIVTTRGLDSFLLTTSTNRDRSFCSLQRRTITQHSSTSEGWSVDSDIKPNRRLIDLSIDQFDDLTG